tara:strand:+ start:634 stop:852 length:219 start_codon:yes stop_codon:yes gene_type:complete
MKELLRTTDIVRLSFLTALLRDAGLEPLVLDNHMSVLEGSANAIPRRLAVRDEDFSRAKWVLEESGEQFDAE